jgi:hypothetical protein
MERWRNPGSAQRAIVRLKARVECPLHSTNNRLETIIRHATTLWFRVVECQTHSTRLLPGVSQVSEILL